MKPAAFVLGLILAAATVTAQTGRAPDRSLSIEECIRVALEHNLEIQIGRLDPQLAGFSLAGSYASYDPTLGLGASHDYRAQPGGLDENNRPYAGNESDADNLNGSLSGLLPWGLSY
jgi:hypothetical protein